MNTKDFEFLFRRKLNEAADVAEETLRRPVPRNFGILRESPKADGRRISVEEAVAELFLSETTFYRIIDLMAAEVSPTTTWAWVRESGHRPVAFEASWNQPPGSGPFKHLIAYEIRISAETL